MACDLQNGRLNEDCLEGVAGVHTVYFFKHSLQGIVKDLAGVITYIGAGNMYRFEQDKRHGQAIQEVVRGADDTQYLRLQIDLTIQYMRPEFLYTINALKNGLWSIFFLDYERKIRCLGEHTPMYQLGGVDQSGTSAGDSHWTNLSFEGMSNNFAPYLADYTNYPFDNFPDIIMNPEYVQPEGLLLYNDAEENYKVDNGTDVLKSSG